MTAGAGPCARASLATPGEAMRLGEARVGGKALSLARLTAAGERVPAWSVLPANVLEEHLRAAGARDTVADILRALARSTAPGPSVVHEASRRLQEVVDALSLDAALALELDMLGSCPADRFAVRSSAVGEDGERYSYAGQFDSLLGVPTHELGRAVTRCWRSAYSPHALAYRLRAGALDDASRLAVIVQRMVQGDVSGVLFTADPMTADGTRMRVSACRGLGDTLVSGETDADEYHLSRHGAVVGTPRVTGATAVVPTATLRDLTAVGRRIARREGGPRDIEWTMRGGVIHVLQSRPLTRAALPAASAQRIVWDNSNIQESYCGVTTPLTFSFAREAYADVYEQTMRTLGLSEAVIAEHRPLLRSLLGLLHGRVYYNLNAWYRGLLLLPAFRRNKDDMERMMGVEEPVDFVADEGAPLATRLRRLPRLMRTLGILCWRFVTLARDAERFLRHFDSNVARLDRATLSRRPLHELMAALEHLRINCLARWTTPIVNDFHVMMSVGRLRRFVARAVAASEPVEPVLQSLLGGAAVAVSAGPALLMLRLAELARGDAAVRAALLAPDAAAALDGAGAASADVARVVADLMARYGDRCMGELKLESRSLRDDPAFVVRMVRNYLHAAPSDPARLAEAARAPREMAERRVRGALGPVDRMRFARALAAARAGIARREEMRLARTRLFGLHRDVYRAIGARLCESGRLVRADDVFYLTVAELRDFWDGTGASADLGALARARRAEFAAYEHAGLPNRLVTIGVPHEGLRALGLTAHATPPARASGERVLRGLGCSAGVAEGCVRIVRSSRDDLAIDGHILVAPRTDPGWAPLFPSARAIVVERGSLLSHSAVLARELGLPAVVGFPGILDTLRDGERIRVDGAAGTIERLEVP